MPSFGASAGEPRAKAVFRVAHVLIAVALAALASALFLTLSVVDNKYAKPGPQGINGILYLNDAEVGDQAIHYLCDGWAFYPDQLLAPDTLDTAGADALRYISLGQYGNFSMDDNRRSPHGSGTYVMTLHLPDERRAYALNIPEVYSAYELYIDDELVVSLGNPHADGYVDAIGEQTVAFEGSGTVTLLFAVSDYSYVYGGMTHPVALGNPQAIATVREARIGAAAATECMTLLLGLLALALAVAVREKRAETGLFALLCAATAVFISYPIVRGLFVLPAQPWYTLEIVSGYVAVLLVIAICNTLCETSRAAKRASVLTAGAFCLIAVAFSISAPLLSKNAITLFSMAAFCFKLAAAAYLLLCAAQRIGRTGRIHPMLFASVLYAASVIGDRLIPQYEPIVGGWFMEWGCLGLVLATGISLTSMIASGYQRGLSLAAQRRAMEQQIAVQSEHLRQTAAWEEVQRTARHDFRQHLNLIAALARENRTTELTAYLENMDATSRATSSTLAHLCDHVELNALLNHYRSVARDRSIDFTAHVAAPQNISIGAVDLCIIVGNLLENAFEACAHRMRRANDAENENGNGREAREGEGEHIHETSDNANAENVRYSVLIAAEMAGDLLVIVIDNEPADEPRLRDGQLLSSKREGWGIGLSSVHDTVKSLGGTLSIEYAEERFSVSLYLPTLPSTRENIG
ncbi:MAG: ATP-binding protein [Gordonibacter sp.]